MATPSTEPAFNSTNQTTATTQTVALSSVSHIETGVDGGQSNGLE